MQEFEYRTFKLHNNKVSEIDGTHITGGQSEFDQLKEFGEGGWELVSVTLSAQGISSFFLKRPAQPQKGTPRVSSL